MPKSKTTDGVEPALKRLGGGRWQTRDERFTIEPQSGTWVLVDAEQTDDLGLALVRGPFRSLTEAKAEIEAARAADAPSSPLTARVAERRAPAEAPESGEPEPAKASARGRAKAEPASKRVTKPAEPPAPPPEPRWLTDLPPADRRRARRAIAALEADGIRDAEGIARRDLVGDVPAITAAALSERLADLVAEADDDPDAGRPAELAATIASVLADGHDSAFDVRWRLVDEAGRPIHLSAADLAAALDRRRKQRR
jgi:hypothetical protein